jgi:hypothetical protein
VGVEQIAAAGIDPVRYSASSLRFYARVSKAVDNLFCLYPQAFAANLGTWLAFAAFSLAASNIRPQT